VLRRARCGHGAGFAFGYNADMQAFDVPTLPLVEDANGVIRVVGTRIQLETVVTAFDSGSTPEEIVQNYPTLTLSAVYAIIAYVLQNRSRVDAYMASRQQQANALRSTIESGSAEMVGFRERLLARQRPPE
jgi:uncharacterized protein (DUF433 family)